MRAPHVSKNTLKKTEHIPNKAEVKESNNNLKPFAIIFLDVAAGQGIHPIAANFFH
jgi:hypothetical protein